MAKKKTAQAEQAASKDAEPARYDDQVQQLQHILHRLEQEELPFDEVLSLYQQGQQLLQRCQTYLDEAEVRFTQVMEEEDGTLTEAPLAMGDAEEDE